jgi:hypothetical protein
MLPPLLAVIAELEPSLTEALEDDNGLVSQPLERAIRNHTKIDDPAVLKERLASDEQYAANIRREVLKIVLPDPSRWGRPWRPPPRRPRVDIKSPLLREFQKEFGREEREVDLGELPKSVQQIVRPAMSLLDKVRNALGYISGKPDQVAQPTVVKQIRQNALDVVNEALLDPAFCTALQQRRRRDIQKIRELLQSPERIADFAEREKEILIRLGAHREWADYFFHDLNLAKQFPAELLEQYSPSEIFHTLEKLRLALACGSTVGIPQQADAADVPKFVAGAVHTTFGVALLLGNSSGFIATLFAAPVVAPATLVSFGLGGYACSRAYVRLTEAIGL